MGQDESTLVDDSVPPHTLTARTLSAVAEHIQSGDAKRIVVLTGAGISTAAGIPDFRSPKTGLYSNLARLNLPYAEAVFDISYFREHPEPFYFLAKELYPGKFHPTISHAFISLLAKKGLLHMLFTQNIDCLERRAGVPAEKIVEAHGSFAAQRCIECKREFPDDRMKELVFKEEVPRCSDAKCNGLVKPDIVFFGESLPKSFEQNAYQTTVADLVLIIGTSLTVYPFAKLPDMASPGKPRVLFNMEQTGSIGSRADDVLELGACDAGIRSLAGMLGWQDELDKLWREVVGNEEADRQTRSQRSHDKEIEDEVEILAENVEAALNFEEAADSRPVDEPQQSADDGISKVEEKNEDVASSNKDVGAYVAQLETLIQSTEPVPSAAPQKDEPPPKEVVEEQAEHDTTKETGENIPTEKGEQKEAAP